MKNTPTRSAPAQRAPEQIYAVLATIPRGRVVSYGQLAAMAGLPRAARLVGTTLKKLPKDTVLPWHRVINAQGRISFPLGSDGYQRQKTRLLAEGVEVIGLRVSLSRYRWQP